MSNKKKSIRMANLLLEQRFLNENTDSVTMLDKYENLWYVSEVPNSSPKKYKIYVQLKGNDEGTDPSNSSEIATKNRELGSTVGNLKTYFRGYDTEDDAKRVLSSIIQRISNLNTSAFSREDLVGSIAKTIEPAVPKS